jgi:CBS domain-containing protein
MSRQPVTVPPELTVAELVNDYVYEHHHKVYPVTEAGRLLGYVATRAVKQTPRARWAETRVRDIMVEAGPGRSLTPDSDAVQALSRMQRSHLSRLAVVDGDGRVVGILSLKDLLAFFALKTELEEGVEPGQLADEGRDRPQT